MDVSDNNEEETNIQIEFEWFVQNELQRTLQNLRDILIECSTRLPLDPCENGYKRMEKYQLIAAQDQLKCSLTLTGDSITQADISFKLKRSSAQVQRISVVCDAPWKLQQVQDAANHLQIAIKHIDNVDENYKFRSSQEILQLTTQLTGALQRGRSSLLIPRKKSLEELMKSRNVKSLVPNLPEDQAISFFLQSHKLVIAVYQLINVQGTVKVEAIQADCCVDWLNEVLVLFTVGLTLCQQLKDKLSVFQLYTTNSEVN